MTGRPWAARGPLRDSEWQPPHPQSASHAATPWALRAAGMLAARLRLHSEVWIPPTYQRSHCNCCRLTWSQVPAQERPQDSSTTQGPRHGVHNFSASYAMGPPRGRQKVTPCRAAFLLAIAGTRGYVAAPLEKLAIAWRLTLMGQDMVVSHSQPPGRVHAAVHSSRPHVPAPPGPIGNAACERKRCPHPLLQPPLQGSAIPLTLRAAPLLVNVPAMSCQPAAPRTV